MVILSELNVEDRKANLRIAVICSSNMNRSMEAHRLLKKKGFNIESFGTGSQVKLPGTSADKPNVYPFDTPYEQIYQDLVKKDKAAYTNNGVLNMLDRNRRIKKNPEKFQMNKDFFNIVLTCEERVYDQVLEDFNTREQTIFQQCHIINCDITDNHEDATLGAIILSQLMDELVTHDDIDNDIDEVLQDFEESKNRALMHSVLFY